MIAHRGLGYARWDPKLPPWWPMWLASMVFLTALPEEDTVPRRDPGAGCTSWLGEPGRGARLAAVVAGALFGLAHAGGGWTYVVLAAIAGIGYGWIYAVSGSLGAATGAHGAEPAAPAVLQLSCAAPRRLEQRFSIA